MANSIVAKNFSKIIPKEVDSETKINKYLSLKTFVIALISIVVTQQFSGIVHPKLTIPYAGFCFVLSLLLVVPAYQNPGKHMFHTLMFSAVKDKTVYHPIELYEE